MILVIGVSLLLFIICVISARLILPENCRLFDDNIPGGFECDGFTVGEPDRCSENNCEDLKSASAASIITGLGVYILFLPFFVLAIKNFQNNSVKEIKLFD